MLLFTFDCDYSRLRREEPETVHEPDSEPADLPDNQGAGILPDCESDLKMDPDHDKSGTASDMSNNTSPRKSGIAN